VWIAEQKVEKEKKRIEDFKKLMAEERQIEEMRRLQEAAGARPKVDRVEWMYNVPMSAEEQAPSAEDILSGRVHSREDEERIKKVRERRGRCVCCAGLNVCLWTRALPCR
jgi:hypothetical protein